MGIDVIITVNFALIDILNKLEGSRSFLIN